MANTQESKRHHYTPEFLMDKWVVENSSGHRILNAHYWDSYKNCVRCRSDKGPKAYCHKSHLLTLENPHPEGRDAIERQFFGEIDTKGALVRDVLLQSKGAVTNLTVDQRCDWARLLLSLDARRPDNVSKLTNEGAAFLREELNNDEEILDVLSEEGVTCSPAEYVEKNLYPLKDRATGNIQALVDNPKVGKVLINAHWHVIQLDDSAVPLMLSDRPLIRMNAYDSPGAVWVMPISPSAVFIAVNHPENLRRLLSVSHRQFSKQLNISSASQTDKYIFSISAHHESWLGKYLGTLSAMDVEDSQDAEASQNEGPPPQGWRETMLAHCRPQPAIPAVLVFVLSVLMPITLFGVTGDSASVFVYLIPLGILASAGLAVAAGFCSLFPQALWVLLGFWGLNLTMRGLLPLHNVWVFRSGVIAMVLMIVFQIWRVRTGKFVPTVHDRPDAVDD